MKNCIPSLKCVADRQNKGYHERSHSLVWGVATLPFIWQIGGGNHVKKAKRALCLLVLALCAAGLMGCGGKAEEPAPTVEPAPSAATGDNPLKNAVIDYLNQRDYSVAKTNEILETYQPEEGKTDYTNLIASLFTPNFKADDGLVDLLQSMVKSEQTDTGFHMTTDSGGSGDLVLEGSLYTYHFQEQQTNSDETITTISHTASLQQDGSQLDAKTEKTQQGGVPVLTTWLQIKRAQDAYQVQQYFTSDGGGTYQLIQMRFQKDQLEYAVYDDVEQDPRSLFEQGHTFFADGFVTRVTLKDGKVVVNNDGKTLEFGA